MTTRERLSRLIAGLPEDEIEEILPLLEERKRRWEARTQRDTGMSPDNQTRRSLIQSLQGSLASDKPSLHGFLCEKHREIDREERL